MNIEIEVTTPTEAAETFRLPALDKQGPRPGVSEMVFVRCIDNPGVCRFGRYNHQSGLWEVEGYGVHKRVIAWCPIVMSSWVSADPNTAHALGAEHV